MILYTARRNLDYWLNNIIIIGILFTLSGLTWVADNSKYHTIYYILIGLPTVLLTITQPNTAIKNNSAIINIFIIFSIWSILSIFWSDTQEGLFTPIKRTIYIYCLFIAFSSVHINNPKNLLKLFIVAGCITFLFSSLSFYTYINSHQQAADRFVGSGALRNSLLSSHIFGFFTTLFLSLLLVSRSKKEHIINLLLTLGFFIFVISTGSRTPILALVATSIWLSLILKNKKTIIAFIMLIATLSIIYVIYPETILSRGFSYRPELWNGTIEMILAQPILGYGFDSNTDFYISSINTSFREPHNMHLSILYFTGVIGFFLWCAMHAYALWACWINKTNTLFIIASALLIYGIMAGMTEGGALLSRPKEHWFITWIPLALISALLAKEKFALKNEQSLAHKN